MIGQRTWSVEFLGIASTSPPPSTLLSPQGAGYCGSKPCVALLDSGTSLIILPSSLMSEMAPLFRSIAADCSNIDSLPDLHFNLGVTVPRPLHLANPHPNPNPKSNLNSNLIPNPNPNLMRLSLFSLSFLSSLLSHPLHADPLRPPSALPPFPSDTTPPRAHGTRALPSSIRKL